MDTIIALDTVAVNKTKEGNHPLIDMEFACVCAPILACTCVPANMETHTHLQTSSEKF